MRSLGGRFADFTLPYWDGKDDFPRTKNPPAGGGPQPADSLLGGDGSPVAAGPFNGDPYNGSPGWTSYNPNGPNPGVRTKLRRNFNAAEFAILKSDSEKSMNDLLDPTKNNTYTDLLCGTGTTGIEGASGLHNDQHGAVGGNLGANTTAVPDPAFWLLHSFADLNWARWEALKGAKYTGGAGYGVNDPMSGGLTELNTANLYRPDGTVRPADVLNYFTMPGGGYTYEYGGAMIGAPAPEPATLALLLPGLAILLTRRRSSNIM